jgi:hypothetical protein
MKRRTFIKRGSIGLGAAVVGAGGAGRLLHPGDGKRRVYGIPDSVKRRTPLERNLVRYSLARTDLPPGTWDDLVALSLLAQDVFDHPEVAQAFARNPQGYLRTIGLDEVALDPKATEVKVALALGDPEVRAAILNDDPRAFLQVIENRGLLRNPEPSQIASRLSEQIEAVKARLGPGVSPEACSAVVVCVAIAFLAIWTWVGAVQDVVVVAFAAASVGVYALALVQVKAVGGRKMIPDAVLQNPSFRMATALGGQDFGDRVAETFVDDNLERIVNAVESLQIYQEKKPMSTDQLRDLLRANMFRQLGGHAACFGEVNP